MAVLQVALPDMVDGSSGFRWLLCGLASGSSPHIFVCLSNRRHASYSLAQGRPFDLCISPFWSISSQGPESRKLVMSKSCWQVSFLELLALFWGETTCPSLHFWVFPAETSADSRRGAPFFSGRGSSRVVRTSIKGEVQARPTFNSFHLLKNRY